MYTQIGQPVIPPGYQIIGTCSICGGPVCVPTVWGSICQPIPQCFRCSAIKNDNYGPIIDMKPVQQCVSVWTTTTSSTEYILNEDDTRGEGKP